MKHILRHDIFPPLEVHDNSLWIFILLVIAGVSVISIVWIWLLKRYRFNKDRNFKNYLKILKKCDLTQARASAYSISYYGRLLAQSEEENFLLESLIAELEFYKYKKNTPELSLELKEQFFIFVDKIESKYV